MKDVVYNENEIDRLCMEHFKIEQLTQRFNVSKDITMEELY